MTTKYLYGLKTMPTKKLRKASKLDCVLKECTRIILQALFASIRGHAW